MKVFGMFVLLVFLLSSLSNLCLPCWWICRRPFSRAASQNKDETATSKKDDDEGDNWDLPEGDIPNWFTPALCCLRPSCLWFQELFCFFHVAVTPVCEVLSMLHVFAVLSQSLFTLIISILLVHRLWNLCLLGELMKSFEGTLGIRSCEKSILMGDH